MSKPIYPSFLDEGWWWYDPILREPYRFGKKVEKLPVPVGGLFDYGQAEQPAKTPDHYSKCSIEPIDYIMKNGLGFCEGNIIKYITRWREKGGVEDLKKVIHYVELLAKYEGLKL